MSTLRHCCRPVVHLPCAVAPLPLSAPSRSSSGRPCRLPGGRPQPQIMWTTRARSPNIGGRPRVKPYTPRGGRRTIQDTTSSASEARGDELVDPSTIDGDKWVVHKKGRTWCWQFCRRGVCDGNVLSPSLSVLNYLLKASWKQSAVKPATIYTATPQAHVRQAKAAQKQQTARLAAGHDTAMLLAIYCSSCWVSIVLSSVCAQCSKTLCVQVRYVKPRYRRCIVYFSIELSTVAQHPFLVVLSCQWEESLFSP